MGSGSAAKVTVRALLAGRGEAALPHEKKSAARYEEFFKELKPSPLLASAANRLPSNPQMLQQQQQHPSRSQSRSRMTGGQGAISALESEDSLSLSMLPTNAPLPDAPAPLHVPASMLDEDSPRLLPSSKQAAMKRGSDRDDAMMSQQSGSLTSLRRENMQSAGASIVPLDSVGAIRKSLELPSMAADYAFPMDDSINIKTKKLKKKKHRKQQQQQGASSFATYKW
jgi:hypothetical protein